MIGKFAEFPLVLKNLAEREESVFLSIRSITAGLTDEKCMNLVAH